MSFKTGVRQGCLLSPFLFLLAIDWVLKTSTTHGGNGIQWAPWTHLDDLDFADDPALLSHAKRQMQEKTSMVADDSARLSPTIYKGKTKVLKNNAAVSTIPIALEGDELEDVTSFTYLGGIFDKQGKGGG